MESYFIIDSHCHFGPSLSLGIEVKRADLISQMREANVSFAVIMPFPSTAIASDEINVRVLEESRQTNFFIPYHYIREDFERDDFDPIPPPYYGGKWHWMRGRQDFASNYQVIKEEKIFSLIDKLRKSKKPVLFEEELRFTEMFLEIASGVTLIIPHLGLLGGNPFQFLKAFEKKENVYFDTSLAPQEVIREFLRKIGPQRILFGSDYPFGNMKAELYKILTLPLSEREKNLVLSENFMRLSGFSGSGRS